MNRGYGKINRTIIRCSCGHRILPKEVVQTGLYFSLMGPNFVYVRFRCGRCKRVGEQLVQEDLWHPSILQQLEARLSEADLRRFRDLGEITPEEVIDFHYALEGLDTDPQGEASRS